MKKICLVEDEIDLNDVLSIYLKKENFEVISCFTYQEACLHLNENIAYWVIDLMLPDGIGFDILKKVKNKSKARVILISARGDSIDRVLGFEMGCDDYIAKPFLPKELIYRLQNLKETETENELNELIFNDYAINLKKRFVSYQGTPITLTSKEYDLLIYFIENKGIALSREQIILQGWNEMFIGSD